MRNEELACGRFGVKLAVSRDQRGEERIQNFLEELGWNELLFGSGLLYRPDQHSDFTWPDRAVHGSPRTNYDNTTMKTPTDRFRFIIGAAYRRGGIFRAPFKLMPWAESKGRGGAREKAIGCGCWG